MSQARTEALPVGDDARSTRPRPAITSDNELFWRGVEEGRLLIRQCRCGRLRHPPVPPLDYPNVIALVALEEGMRIVSNLRDVDPRAVEVGMPVQAELLEREPGRRFLQFVPVLE